ncbi:SDR family oxidoreductase [Kineococcus sp. SYSU DK006]|uniref:SDR family oxidoreductase n=1 Tax=Kineococcus sp. SYSU DK006 TaxID=3383127 RepID=UPI003D7F02F8
MPTALITGGTTGIGRATAELLHTRGHRVAVTGQDPDALAAARRELPADVLVVRADARVSSDTDALVQTVTERLGRLDLLFLNAGIFRPAPVGEVSEESFDDHVAVNLKGQFFTLQKDLPLMNDGASIVVTVGIAARRGSPGATDTPLLDELGVASAERDALRANVPFQRFGSPREVAEVAEVAAFLASDAASYVTGQDVAVAGGYGLGA